ncbi:MAG: hypothetical protein Greene101449_818 [Candidatus Peregrinibacteria bacterium Greene1014_49]|nr:MAG: hypothetical protein Greene101449_818 [Candidatus Peregrinibacteria bacterium Greene1014_49]
MEGSAGAIVDLLHGLCKFLGSDGTKIRSFREESPQESVAVFIQSSLPGAVGFGAVDDDLESSRDLLMLRDFRSVVVRHGEATFLRHGREDFRCRSHHFISSLVFEKHCAEVFGVPFYERCNSTGHSPGAHDEIAFPIPTPLLLVDDLWSFTNIPPVGNMACRCPLETIEPRTLSFARQMKVQTASLFFCLPDVAVDRFVTYRMFSVPRRCALHSSGDRIGAFSCTQMFHDVPENIGIVVPVFPLPVRGCASQTGTLLCHMGGVTIIKRRTTALQFSTDRGLRTADEGGDLLLLCTELVEHCQLITLATRKMSHDGRGERVLKPSLLPYFRRIASWNRDFQCVSLLNSGNLVIDY